MTRPPISLSDPRDALATYMRGAFNDLSSLAPSTTRRFCSCPTTSWAQRAPLEDSLIRHLSQSAVTSA